MPLDTHVVLWYLSKDSNLSPKAKEIVDTKADIYFSIVSLWEIAIKVNIGKLQINRPIEALPIELQYMNIQVLPITIRDIEIYSSLPLPNTPIKHRDPFDRILIAQAINHSFHLVSRDNAFDAYPIPRMWE
ncbi:MAG: PIN domain nuclease [Pseudanabaena frigida]|uniref:PIN domain nuclease n=1 Tax=Pseudanabaena frigida TaxID=945775 RepID=A0A2W4WPE1_9CYAN|nr:MAG: PIN domain nuclease [Pseudanabaena frigida]